MSKFGLRFWSAVALLLLFVGAMATINDGTSFVWTIAGLLVIATHVLSFYLPPIFPESHYAAPTQHETATDAENGNETDS
jgi:hypothetical protein